MVEDKMKTIKKRIDGINDTLYICYYASKHGLNYKKLLQDDKN